MNAKTDKANDPRRVAMEWLAQTMRGSDLEAARPRAIAKLEPRDRAFARVMVMTALRRRGQIEAVLGGFLDRPLPNKAADVSALLHLGIAQLLFLQTPPHAAVSTAVGLAKGAAKGRFAGLVNAVLRRCIRDGADILEGQDTARLNTPGWLWDSWMKAYGTETTRAIATAHLGEAPLDLTVPADIDAWAERLGGQKLGTGSVRLGASGAVDDLPGYTDGAWWVQDRAAAIPATLFGDIAGKRVLDMCAAPGGKTMQLIAAGADVTAVDCDDHRMDRLAANLRRVGMTATTRVADAASMTAETGLFDAVLLDAPCTATGTIRRHPDVAWRRRPGDAASMAQTQARLLRVAAELLAPGGRLVFATCSLQPEEGASVVAAANAAGAGLIRDPLDPVRDGLDPAWMTAEGDLRTLPCHGAESGGMDGFFTARLTRP